MGKPESEYRYTAYEIFKITQAGNTGKPTSRIGTAT